MFVWKKVTFGEMRNTMGAGATGLVAAAGLLGVFLLGLGVQSYLGMQEFLGRSERVEMEVVDYVRQPVRRGASGNVKPVLRYTNEDGNVLEVPSGGFSVIRPYEIGEHVWAYVDMGDPTHEPVVDTWWERNRNVFVLFFAGGMFVMTTLFLFAFATGVLNWKQR